MSVHKEIDLWIYDIVLGKRVATRPNSAFRVNLSCPSRFNLTAELSPSIAFVACAYSRNNSKGLRPFVFRQTVMERG